MSLAAETFCCPGESYAITRAVHLGRLSTFHAACRGCPHRGDVAGLSTNLQKQLAASAHDVPGTLLTAEGIAGIHGDQIDAVAVRRFASDFGLWLRNHDTGASTGGVLLAGDDRALTADLIAAASEGLRYVGCNVIDLGGATAPSFAHEMVHRQAAAGILIGNAPSELRTASVSLWLASGRPLSGHQIGEPLAEIWSMSTRSVARPTRRYGRWERADGRQRYVERLQPYFHALRPLEFLLDTGCVPLKRTLNGLLASVACRAYSPGELDERLAERLHFRIWIDGDGESLRLFDERGLPVAADRLLCLLAQHTVAEQSAATVVAEQETSPACLDRLRAAGLTVISSASGRAEMHAAMAKSTAMLGGGPSGRIWFGGPTPAADAMETLAQLLVILSQSDRPLSRVLSD
jgi:phosphomannomutase